MKFRTTQKEIKNAYGYVFKIPYCDAWHLLKGREPEAYTAGVYGWNADIYSHGGVAIVTGYRPFGEATPRELLKKYEVRDIDELNRFISWLKWNNEQKSDIIKELLKVGEMAKNFID